MTTTRWRFIEPLEKKNYFEEEVVQHVVTEHRAIRRIFSSKVLNDSTTLELVKEQHRKASQVTPPCLPLIYHFEEIDGNFAVVMELVEGIRLMDQARERVFKDSLRWAQSAVRLSEMFLDLREAGARFEKLDVEDILVSDLGTMRVRERCPIGKPPTEICQQNSTVERMARQPRSGVYVGGKLDRDGELEFIAELFMRMYSGPRATFDELVEGYQKQKAKGVNASQATEILLDLYNGRGGRGIIRDLETLRERLIELVRTLRNEKADSKTSSSYIPTPATDPEVIPDFLKIDVPKRGSGSRGPKPSPVPATSPKPDDGGNPYAAPEGSPKAKSTSGMLLTPKEELHRPQGFPSAIPNRDEDVNPYAEPEAKKPTSSGPKPAKTNSSASTPFGSPIPKRSGLPLVPIAIVLIVVLVVVGVVASGVLSGSAPNTAPIAALDKSTITAKINEVIPIDAASSSDAEEDNLTYYWTITSPADATGIFTDKGDRKGSNVNLYITRVDGITVQFLNAGSYTLELIVSDGKLKSSAVTATISVNPL